MIQRALDHQWSSGDRSAGCSTRSRYRPPHHGPSPGSRPTGSHHHCPQLRGRVRRASACPGPLVAAGQSRPRGGAHGGADRLGGVVGRQVVDLERRRAGRRPEPRPVDLRRAQSARERGRPGTAAQFIGSATLDGRQPARASSRDQALDRGPPPGELDVMRRRLGIPGVSVTIIFRDGSSGPARAVTPTSPARSSHPRHRLRPRQRQQDLHRRADPRARPATARRPRRPGPRTPGGGLDPKITVRSSSTTRADSTTSSCTRRSTRRSRPSPTPYGPSTRTLNTSRKPYFPPGRGWHYSNTNYLYLGLIAERVTGVTARGRAPRRGSSPRSASTQRGTRRSRSRAARSPTATASPAPT